MQFRNIIVLNLNCSPSKLKYFTDSLSSTPLNITVKNEPLNLHTSPWAYSIFPIVREEKCFLPNYRDDSPFFSISKDLHNFGGVSPFSWRYLETFPPLPIALSASSKIRGIKGKPWNFSLKWQYEMAACKYKNLQR